MAAHSVKISIKRIMVDPRYYPRFQVDRARVKEFTEAMECGEHFPPIKVVRDKKTGMYILLDGQHRLEAFIQRGEVEILVNIFSIPEEHWLMAAARFNGKSTKPLHGDEIKQIIAASWRAGIKDTDEIAREMGCSVRYVEKMLKPVRDEERNKREEKILELNQQGMSQRQIASEVGLALSAINKALNSNGDTKKDTLNEAKGAISENTEEPTGIDQVFSKRTKFVLRTPKENNNIDSLYQSTEKSALNYEVAIPKNSMEQKPGEDIDDKSIKTPTEDISRTPNELPEVDQLIYKRSDFVFRSPNENHDIRELEISPQKSLPDDPKNHSQNSIQTVPISANSDHSKITSQDQKTTQYPSYLDQIDAYNKLPAHIQHTIRVLELARHYKMDIVDIAKEIDEPVIWIRKVLLSAMALSLMRGDKIDDASRVETLIGIEFKIIQCIQGILVFQKMLDPISPEMEHWVKNNLSQDDLDLILNLVDTNHNDLPHLLKGESSSPQTKRLQKLPDCYKEQLQANIAVFRELRDLARNKKFNSDSAKQLLSHLNKNVTVINEIVDELREEKLL